jgi:AcrR family transcriptional regulator
MPAKADRPSTRGGGPARERELRAQGRKTMRKLLDAGMQVFARRGYHAARVDDIVKGARTSHGTFYLYFSNKEDLFRALLADAARELEGLSAALAAVGPDDEGRAALREWLASFVELYERYGPVIRAWTEAEMSGSELGQLGDDLLGGFTAVLAQRIRTTAAPGTNADIAALALVAMVERVNYYVQSRALPVDRDQLLDTLTAIIHVGLLGGAPQAKRAKKSVGGNRRGRGR